MYDPRSAPHPVVRPLLQLVSTAVLSALCALVVSCAEDSPEGGSSLPDLEAHDSSVVGLDDVLLEDGSVPRNPDQRPGVSPPDGGAEPLPDASQPDGANGPNDAGNADASASDAGPTDAGPSLDANAGVDAAVTDAGLDAALFDAGPDAALIDAGPKDASAPYDAAFVEAGTPGVTTFTRVYAILGSRCRSCHTPGNDTDLNWTTKQRAYETLVRGAPDYQPSTYPVCKTGGHKRVVPYQPDASLLYTKLARIQPCGLPMPLTSPLEAELLPEIRAWIMDGALNN